MGPDPQQVSFASGEVTREVYIILANDDEVEGDESFEVNLELVSSSHPNATLGERTTLTVIIEDSVEVEPTDPPGPGM